MSDPVKMPRPDTNPFVDAESKDDASFGGEDLFALVIVLAFAAPLAIALWRWALS